MKDKKGRDTQVEFQSDATKKKRLATTPKPRPKGIGKNYANQPIRKPAFADNKVADAVKRTKKYKKETEGLSIKNGQVTRKGATNYTLRLLDPSGKPKKRNDKAPLTGKDKRGTRSRLNPFIDYGEKKKPKKKENGIIKPVYKGPTIIKKKKSKA